MPILCELVPKRGLTPNQYEHLGRLLKQFCIEHCCPIADFRSVRDLLAGELPKPLVLRKAEDAKPQMEDDEDRWHFRSLRIRERRDLGSLQDDATRNRSGPATQASLPCCRRATRRGRLLTSSGPWF